MSPEIVAIKITKLTQDHHTAASAALESEGNIYAINRATASALKIYG